MRRRIGVTLSLCLIACGSATTHATPAYVGTWTLVSANGQALPYAYGFGFTIDDATATLAPVGDPSTMVEDENHSTTRDDAIVERQGSGFILHWPTTFHVPYNDPIAVSGDAMTLVSARWTGVPVTYRFTRAH